jgi:hypothetical protein
MDGSSLSDAIAELEMRLGEEQRRFYSSGQMDAAAFGMRVKGLLEGNRLSTESLRIGEQEENPHLEFIVNGEAQALIRFIETLETSRMYHAIPYLSVRSLGGSGQVIATIKTYFEVWEGAADSSGSLDPELAFAKEEFEIHTEDRTDAIARLFRWSAGARRGIGDGRGEREQEDSSRTSAGEPEKVTKADWLRYVGTYVQEGRTYFLFKDVRSERIHRIHSQASNRDGWRYLRADRVRHYLEKDGVVYVVDR